MSEKVTSQKEMPSLLVPENRCLRVALIRDLSCRYQRDCKELGDDTRDPLDPQNMWRVAGAYDFLRVESFEDLEDLGSRKTDLEVESAFQEVRSLVLFPYRGFNPGEEFVRKLEKRDEKKSPLLVLTQIVLSAVAYEFGPGEGWVLKAIRSLIALVKEESDKLSCVVPETAYLGSLSGPDLVIVSLPRSADELAGAHALARVARTMRLGALRQRTCGEDVHRNLGGDEKCPGHACVLVQPMLAFCPSQQALFEDQTFAKAERQHRMRLNFDLRVCCGHELGVMRDVTQVAKEHVLGSRAESGCRLCGEVHPPVAFDTLHSDHSGKKRAAPAWDHYPVRGKFYHLATFTEVWKKLWFKRSWRDRNLVSSYTVLSVSDDADDVPGPSGSAGRPIWAIHQDVDAALKLIKQQLDTFAERYLNRTQQRELRNLYRSFHMCFYRPELAGVSRDLFPFFRQLGAAFALLDQWEAFFSKGPKYELRNRSLWFPAELNRLIAHCNRAIRNRLEHRSTVADPPFPLTLRDGACKTISAYTTVLYLCWEFFRRSEADPLPGGTQDNDKGADHFAACVRVGGDGRVVCEELLTMFREFVEENTERRLSSGRKGWTARLLALDISGPPLRRPEVSIVHSLHEVAELSDFIMSLRCRGLRACLNLWVQREAILAFGWETATRVTFPEGKRDLSPSEEKQVGKCYESNFAVFAANFVPYCLAKLHLKDRVISGAQVVNLLLSLYPSNHPLAFVDQLTTALHDVGTRSTTFAAFTKDFPAQAQPQYAGLCTEVAAGDGLLQRLRTVKALVQEVYADCGMHSALMALLSSDRSLSSDDRTDCLAKVFTSILRLTAQAYASHENARRVAESVLLRWAIQAAAAGGGDWAQKFEKCINELASAVHSVCPEDMSGWLQSKREHQPQFGEENSLVAGLRKFSPYGGPSPIEFVEIKPGDRERSILRAFLDCWSAPTTSARLTLVSRLWARSVRQAIPQMFVLA